MDDYIPISLLNDYIFCPYSIYLHNVYMETDEGLYHAKPQTRGRFAHESIDNKKYSNKRFVLQSLPIISEYLGVIGKIDVYKKEDKRLIERKYELKNIYQGQLYQLWAQYFCMIEMGYEVDSLEFYEISKNRTIPVDLPNDEQKCQLKQFIDSFRKFDPANIIKTNINKCKHCIYCNICDKTEEDNVYQ